MMNNIDKSDSMLCTNNAYLQYNDIYINDKQFIKQMSNTRPEYIRDINKESDLFLVKSSKIKTPINQFNYNRNENLYDKCPDIRSMYENDFLEIPSIAKNTYKNYLVLDPKDCKQKVLQHQILNNCTRRKEITEKRTIQDKNLLDDILNNIEQTHNNMICYGF